MNSFGIIVRGFAAGLVSTCVLSLLMLTKQWVPQLDTITVLDGIARDFALATGMSAPFSGWLWHFAIGTLWWGWMYAVMEPILPGRRPWIKGISFGAIATLMVWIIVLPLAGAGLFGLQLSAVQPLVSLALHLVYGVVLGIAYAALSRRRGEAQ